MALNFDCLIPEHGVPLPRPLAPSEVATHCSRAYPPASVPEAAHELLTRLGEGDSIHVTFHLTLQEDAPTPKAMQGLVYKYNRAPGNMRFITASTLEGVRIWRIA